MLDPIEGNSYELGAQGAWPTTGSRRSAVYNIKRENEVRAGRRDRHLRDLSCCYQSTAEIESKGADAEITGEIPAGMAAVRGVHVQREPVQERLCRARRHRRSSRARRSTSWKLWTMAQLPGTLSALSVGGGINGQSKTFLTGTAVNYGRPARYWAMCRSSTPRAATRW